MSEANRRALRTLLQSAVALAVALPAIVEASGLGESLPWAAGAVAAAGALSRVMALGSVQRLLPPALRTGVAGDRELLALLPEHRGRE
ncbi:hypothetical protein [Streptomyces sp. H27-C3]|uniref:hypothetical protein n=1 Tax=Streptomyces sp. H27-C3 TaxID=3046305 RepID=UPI0024BBDB95|nr:hypothetical protein [Streptomyces sp. H27-C3]MDJ0465184.1 hypothetical protein [Streptomyces sp. H27-C3]